MRAGPAESIANNRLIQQCGEKKYPFVAQSKDIKAPYATSCIENVKNMRNLSLELARAAWRGQWHERRIEMMKSSLSRWTGPLKSCSRSGVVLLCAAKGACCQRRVRKKERGERCPHAGVWRGDQASNRITYQRHITHLPASAYVTQTRWKIKVQLTQTICQKRYLPKHFLHNNHTLWLLYQTLCAAECLLIKGKADYSDT